MIIVPEHKVEYETCNVPDADYEIWSSDKSYSVGDKVSIIEDKLNYFATKDIPAGVRPDPNDLKGLQFGWFAEIPNKYKMLGNTIYNQTINPEFIEFSFKAYDIDVIAFFNVYAIDINIKITGVDSGIIIIDKNINMLDNGISLYHYFFVEPYIKDTLIYDFKKEVPIFMEEILVEVEIRRQNSIAKCGKLFIGKGEELGCSLWQNSSIKTKSFGKIKQDEYFGNYEIERGNTVNQISVNVKAETHRIDYIISRLKKYAYDYCLFIADDSQRITNFTAYGLAEDANFSPKPYSSDYTLKIGSTI